MIVQVLQYRGYRVGEDATYDAVLNERGIELWNHADPQPTPEQLAAWEAEPAFATWLAEHGGDALLTLRREAKEHLNAAQKEAAILRAVIVLTVQELNLLRQWITDFKSAAAAATNLANLQTRIAALPNVPQRTTANVRTAIKAEVTAGGADS